MTTETFKFHSQCVIKTWIDPDDRGQGVNVNTVYGYHATKKEARDHIKEISKMHRDAIQFFGYFHPIFMEIQTIKA